MTDENPTPVPLKIQQKRTGAEGVLTILRISGDAVLVDEPTGKAVYSKSDVTAMPLARPASAGCP